MQPLGLDVALLDGHEQHAGYRRVSRRLTRAAARRAEVSPQASVCSAAARWQRFTAP
jgi:hypothetical protein